MKVSWKQSSASPRPTAPRQTAITVFRVLVDQVLKRGQLGHLGD